MSFTCGRVERAVQVYIDKLSSYRRKTNTIKLVGFSVNSRSETIFLGCEFLFLYSVTVEDFQIGLKKIFEKFTWKKIIRIPYLVTCFEPNFVEKKCKTFRKKASKIATFGKPGLSKLPPGKDYFKL